MKTFFCGLAVVGTFAGMAALFVGYMLLVLE